MVSLRPVDKDTVMTAFRRGDIDVLVATTVIEVGIERIVDVETLPKFDPELPRFTENSKFHSAHTPIQVPPGPA